MATEISRLFVAIGAKTDEFHKGIDGVSNKLNNVSRQMKIAGGIMVGAVAAIGGASLKLAGDFDGAMREVNTMMLLSEDEYKDFSQEIQNLAKTMGVNAVEAANALYQAISAGVPKENAVDFLTIATRAAIGGVTDTKTAVDGLTTVMNAFKLPMEDAQRVADLMFTTVKGGKTTFEELSAAMFNVAPMAASAGVSFDEISAALATMTKQGVPTTQATTQLRQAVQAMIKPTAEMKTALAELGYTSGDALIAEKGLAGALNMLTDASAGSNEILGKMFGSVEGLQAVLALTGENAQVFAKDLEAMANSAGSATDAFEQMEQSTGRQLEKLKVQFQDIAISLGNALMPALTKLLEFIGPIIAKIGDWIAAHPKLSAAILAVVGVVGVLLLTLGPLLSILPMVGVAFTAMLGPIGLIIAAIAGIVAVVVLVIKHWDKIKEKAKEIWEGIKNFFKKIGEGIKNIFLNMTPVGLIIKHWDKIKAAASNIWNGIKGFFSNIGSAIKNRFQQDWEATKEAVKGVWDKIQENSKEFGGGLKGTILGAAKTMTDGFKGFLEKMGIDTEGIGQKLKSIWDGIVGFFKSIPEKIKAAFQKVKDIMLAPFRLAIQGIEKAINWIIRQINKIKITFPDWMPGLGGKTIGFNIPEVSLPSFRYGGIVPGPIGKPVPVIAHGGEYITPTGQGTVNNYFEGPWFVREEADIQRIARELYRLQQGKARALGVT